MPTDSLFSKQANVMDNLSTTAKECTDPMSIKGKGSVKASKRNTKRRDANSLLPDGVGARFQNELLAIIEGKQDFKSQYLREEILTKYLDSKQVPVAVRKEAAIQKWLASERNNAKTNDRLFNEAIMGETDFGFATYVELRARIRSIILSIIGKAPGTYGITNHTSGASTRIKRGAMAPYLKFQGGAHCSLSAVPYWKDYTLCSGIRSDSVGTGFVILCPVGQRMYDQELLQMDSSIMFTVPKKSDIDRVACKEPEINMLLQRCLGKQIRKSLKVVGIDLRDQSINRKLASEAYQRGLATVDLSAASDSITRQLVIELLPAKWWLDLACLRVDSTIITDSSGGEYLHTLEMFSSMGNGFTFELESLLFYAITRATQELLLEAGFPVNDKTISVYGDDIICACTMVKPLANVLGFFRIQNEY